MFKKHLLVVLAVLALTLGSCGGGGSSGGDEDTSFSAGGVTLNTSLESTSTSKTVTVTDENGDTVLTLVVTTTGVTMSAPGQATESMTFRTALDALPTDYTARRMAIFAAGPMATATSASTSASIRQDSPGCDWFPDTQCTLGCCADHDECYDLNNCGASSWLWGFGTDACDNCNDVVYDCIAAACAGVTESFTEDNCYDARCNARYDCPPDYNNCTCEDACANAGVPTTCGNGQCETGETLDNCFLDCGMGTSQSACCVANNDCPSETPTTCPGACCCCGIGYTCNPATHRCEYGDF
jgi:hypothetical protein